MYMYMIPNIHVYILYVHIYSSTYIFIYIYTYIHFVFICQYMYIYINIHSHTWQQYQEPSPGLMACMNVSCYSYERGMASEWTSHVTRMKESCHTYRRVMPCNTPPRHTHVLPHVSRHSHIYTNYSLLGGLLYNNPPTTLPVPPSPPDSKPTHISKPHKSHISRMNKICELFMSHI